MAQRVILGFTLVLVALAGLFAVFAWRAEIAPVEPPARSSFDAALITRGAHLAAIGDCIACHTAPEGKPYAGGYPLRTPFGTIHGTNITPDADTGIGRWSQAAFVRAMREGVDRQGRHLYPAFPYDHFALVSDEELQAIYAFLMTREPVRADPPANDVMFPFNMRVLVAGWKLAFLEHDAFRSDPAQSAEWNRGAYLAQGLGHCGACHTPRNFLGAERKKLYLAGGDAEGWRAPPVDASSRAPVPWTAESLYRYLRHGADEMHEVAAGPMAPVVHNLSGVPESEVRAIATYIASLIGPADVARQTRAEQLIAAARASSETIGEDVPEAQRQGRARHRHRDSKRRCDLRRLLRNLPQLGAAPAGFAVSQRAAPVVEHVDIALHASQSDTHHIAGHGASRRRAGAFHAGIRRRAHRRSDRLAGVVPARELHRPLGMARRRARSAQGAAELCAVA